MNHKAINQGQKVSFVEWARSSGEIELEGYGLGASPIPFKVFFKDENMKLTISTELTVQGMFRLIQGPITNYIAGIIKLCVKQAMDKMKEKQETYESNIDIYTNVQDTFKTWNLAVNAFNERNEAEFIIRANASLENALKTRCMQLCKNLDEEMTFLKSI